MPVSASPAVSGGGLGTTTPGGPASLDTCELLTDATVMCHEYATNHWHRLNPDINGSYQNGTWDSPSSIAAMPNGNDPHSVIISNGTFLRASHSGNIESLDATTLTFTVLNPIGKLDSNQEEGWNILPSGSVLTIDSQLNSSFELFDPAADAWGNSGSCPAEQFCCPFAGFDHSTYACLALGAPCVPIPGR